MLQGVVQDLLAQNQFTVSLEVFIPGVGTVEFLGEAKPVMETRSLSMQLLKCGVTDGCADFRGDELVPQFIGFATHCAKNNTKFYTTLRDTLLMVVEWRAVPAE